MKIRKKSKQYYIACVKICSPFFFLYGVEHVSEVHSLLQGDFEWNSRAYTGLNMINCPQNNFWGGNNKLTPFSESNDGFPCWANKVLLHFFLLSFMLDHWIWLFNTYHSNTGFLYLKYHSWSRAVPVGSRDKSPGLQTKAPLSVRREVFEDGPHWFSSARASHCTCPACSALTRGGSFYTERSCRAPQKLGMHAGGWGRCGARSPSSSGGPSRLG